MNLENLLAENLLSEMGGNVFDFTSRIPRENVQPTIKEYEKQVLNKIGIDKFKPLGSTGKKSSSGDIDLGVETDMSVKEIGQKLNDINIANRPAGTQVWTEFPQYGPDGKKLDSTVQIDIMLGDLEWMENAYYSPAEEESKYKGAHRNLLLGLALRYAKEEDDPKGGKVGLAYSAQGGVNKKRRFKKVMTRGKNKGQEKEDSEFIERNYLKNWDELLQFLSDNTKETWTLADVNQPFEGLLKKVKRSFDSETYENIKAGVVAGCEKKGIDIPKELDEEIQLGFLNVLTEEILQTPLSEASKREMGFIENDNENGDLYKSYRFLVDKIEEKYGESVNLKTSEHVRVDFGDDFDTSDLETFVKGLDTSEIDLEDFDFKDLKVEVLPPYGKDVNSPTPNKEFSGRFSTYKIYNDDKGFYFFATNRSSKGDETIKKEHLAPSNFGLDGKEFKEYDQAYNFVKNKIDKIPDKFNSAKDFMLDLVENIDQSSSINFDPEIASKASNHINQIMVHFGETLSALHYFKNSDGEILKFPSANEPISDFSIDDIEYSVKYKRGAAGTIGEVIKKLDKLIGLTELRKQSSSVKRLLKKADKEDIDTDSEDGDDDDFFKFMDILADDKDNNNSLISLKIAKTLYNKDIYSNFNSFIKKHDINIDVDTISKEDLGKKINTRLRELIDEIGEESLIEEIKEYHNNIPGFSKPKDPIGEILNSSTKYGLITYPISAAVSKRIENDSYIKSEWAKFLNKLYMVYQVKTDIQGGMVVFEEKAFNEIKPEDIEFVAGGSVRKPENQKLRARYK